MGSRWALWLVVCGFAVQAAAQPAAGTPSIQYAEPVALSLKSTATEFDAYGRRFSLSLADNTRVLDKLSSARKAELAPYRLVRGAVDGSPGSWVRLVQSKDGVDGAIWDGQELYAVTQYRKIAASLTTPLDATPDQTVVYRLSDVRDALPHDFCANDAIPADAQVTGLDQYRAVMQELEVQFSASTITRQLEISLIGDAALQAAESDATGAMLARLNIVEGIFSNQLGLLILATDVRLTPANADPFTATKGQTLLSQLATYKSGNPEVRARGIAHLVTGKDLDGSTAGIAYVGTVCSAERGVSLSMSSYGTTVSALIMAHEIGHNLGASHDGEAGTPCANVGNGYIMAPSVSGFATFSACSLGVMDHTIASASCITPAEFADVAIDTPATKVSGEGGLPFTLPFVVTSGGNLDAEEVVVTVTLPTLSGYSLDAAVSSTGSCAVSGLTATCSLGNLAPGSQPTLSVTAHGTNAQSFTAQARVSAGNDRVTSNNSKPLQVSIRSGIDAAVALSSSGDDSALGAPLQIYADVSSQRALPLTNATLAFNFNQPVISASMPGASCSTTAYAVTCTVASVPSGTTRRLTVVSSGATAGPTFASANISASGDGDFTNNTANLSGWVRAPQDVELTAGPPVVDVGVGTEYEIPYTLRARGTGDSTNARLTIRVLSSAVIVDSVDAACVATDETTWQCDVGTLAVDATRVVRIRLRGTRATICDIAAVVVSDSDGYAGNDSASVQMRLDNDVDLTPTLATGGVGVEDTPFSGQVTVRSNGKLTISGAVLDIDLNAAGKLLSASIHEGAACTLLSPQRAHCELPVLSRNGQVYVDYSAQFDDPGDYALSFTTRAVGDSAPDNDVLHRAIYVRPWIDASVAGAIGFTGLLVGETHTSTFTVGADRRALPTARFLAPNALPGLRVTAIQSSAGTCQVDPDLGGSCDFTDLAANSSATVDVTWRAEESTAAAGVSVSVSTAGDVSSTNDSVRGNVETYGMTDLELRVGAPVSGYRNTVMSLPEISVVNGNDKAIGASLQVSLPSGVALVSVSASNAICSGTTVLRCDFSELEAGSVSTVNVSVHANEAGNLASRLQLTATNDASPGNNSRDAEMKVAEATDSSQTASGGKGGGRFEWFGIALLALLVMRRCVVVVRAKRR